MVVHIADKNVWEACLAAGREYAPASLPDEGFIHCSDTAQVIATANRHFRGHGGLVLLCIDEGRLRAELKYEPPADGRPGELFPHLHGPLNLDAVVRVVDFPHRSDGRFDLPPGIEQGPSALDC